ncbi:cysteine-rich CWC family protein [Pseudomonas sp. QL9]|uniref:cysteine-rich CWC family protein n=1 Tax=Pseudomonas TaxID=286 RepID=UPI00352B3236
MTDIDPTRCPLCGQRNRCAQADPAADGASCWCFETAIDPVALQRIAPESVDRACLCPRCAQNLPPEDEPT